MPRCAGTGDLQRSLARLLASAGGEAEGAPRVVYYEDTAKRRVHALIAALKGLGSLQVGSVLGTPPRQHAVDWLTSVAAQHVWQRVALPVSTAFLWLNEKSTQTANTCELSKAYHILHVS